MGATIKKKIARATWRPGFLHPCWRPRWPSFWR